MLCVGTWPVMHTKRNGIHQRIGQPGVTMLVAPGPT